MKLSRLFFGAVITAGVAGLVYKVREHFHAKKHREDTFKHPPSQKESAHVDGGDSAVGVMAQAVRDGAYIQPAFVEMPYGDYKVTVGVDMLKTPDHLRMMVSWPETQEICKKLGCVAPTKKLADAIYDAASTKTAFHSLVTKDDPESGGAKMHTKDFAKKYNADVESQLSGWDGTSIQSGAEKYWLLSPRLAETVKATGQPAAVNYGGWNSSGKPQQSPGAMHDVNYPGDYSQLLRPIMRYAKDKAGNKVDLLDVFAQEGIPTEYLNLFKTEVS